MLQILKKIIQKFLEKLAYYCRRFVHTTIKKSAKKVKFKHTFLIFLIDNLYYLIIKSF